MLQRRRACPAAAVAAMGASPSQVRNPCPSARLLQELWVDLIVTQASVVGGTIPPCNKIRHWVHRPPQPHNCPRSRLIQPHRGIRPSFRYGLRLQMLEQSGRW